MKSLITLSMVLGASVVSAQEVTYYSSECYYAANGITSVNGVLYSYSASERSNTPWYLTEEEAICEGGKVILGTYRSFFGSSVMYRDVYTPLRSSKLNTKTVNE